MSNKLIDKFVITTSKTYESLDEVNESLNKRGFVPGTRIFRVVEVYKPVEKLAVVTYKAEYEKSYSVTQKKINPIIERMGKAIAKKQMKKEATAKIGKVTYSNTKKKRRAIRR